MKSAETILLWCIITSVIFVLSGCGGCPQNINIFGKVTDNNFNPLSGVRVVLFNQTMATTALDGMYSFSTEAYLVGEKVTFIMAGAVPVDAQPFISPEVGNNICGQVQVRRDTVIQ